MKGPKGVASVLAALAMALFAVGCFGGDSNSQEELDRARQEGVQQAKQKAEVEQLQNKVKQLSKQSRQNQNNSTTQSGTGGSAGGTTTQSTGGTRSCADGVSAGPNTSCEFAFNVFNEYNRSGGSSTISVYSPVTGRTYTMYCSGSGPTICAGGNNASVYFP